MCEPYLSLTNDSPAITGANITFYALLSGDSPRSSLTYIFDDGVGVKGESHDSKSSNISVSLRFPSEFYAEGRYRMTVTVEAPELLILKKKIATNYTYFDLKSM